MDLGLKGKVAAVAASSSGLGKAVALGLAREGASVALCSRSPERVEAALEDIRARLNPRGQVLADVWMYANGDGIRQPGEAASDHHCLQLTHSSGSSSTLGRNSVHARAYRGDVPAPIRST